MKTQHFVKGIDKVVKVNYKNSDTTKHSSSKPKITFNKPPSNISQANIIPTSNQHDFTISNKNHQSMVHFNYQNPS